MATRTPGTLSTRRWRFVGVFVLVTALAFGVSVWLGGMSTESVLVSATVGLTLGLVSVPVLMPLNFTSPTLWQIGWAMVGSLLIAYQLDAPGEGYAVAVVLGGLLGWSSPFWIEYVNLP